MPNRADTREKRKATLGIVIKFSKRAKVVISWRPNNTGVKCLVAIRKVMFVSSFGLIFGLELEISYE